MLALDLHQRKLCFGWHICHCDQCHQTSEGTARSINLDQLVDPSRNTLPHELPCYY